MAGPLDIGAVRVSIVGDPSGLYSSFTQAQGAAKTAGAAIASNLTGAMAPAIAGASGLVDQYGRAIQSTVSPTTALTEATTGAAGAQRVLAASTEAATGALGHQVSEISEIQAVSGALRTLESNGGIRAAERFLTTIPGLAGALQTAFPIIGAIAFAEVLTRIIGKSKELEQAQKELADSTKAADDAFSHLQQTMDRLNVAHVTREFGALGGKNAEVTVLKQQADRIRGEIEDARDEINNIAYAEAGSLKNYIPFHSADASVDKIKAAGQNIRNLGAQLQEVMGQIQGAQEVANTTAAEQSGKLLQQRLTNEEEFSNRSAAIERSKMEATESARHAAEQSRIAGLDSEYARVVQTGNEEVKHAQELKRIADGIALATRDRNVDLIQQKAGAEAQGKPADERALINLRAQGEVQGAMDAYTKATVDSSNQVAAANQKAALSVAELSAKTAQELHSQVREGWDAVAKAARETAKAVEESVDRQLQVQGRVQEIEAKTGNASSITAVQLQKIALEHQYGEAVGHTLSQEIDYREKQLELDAQMNALKVQQLQNELAVARTIENEAQRLEQVARIQGEISALKGEGEVHQAQGQAQVSQTIQNAQLGQQIGQSIDQALTKSLPQSLGNSLASGLLGGGKKGEDVGKQIGVAMKELGVHLIGQIFTEMIGKLIETTISQFALNILNNWLIHYASNPLGLFAGGTDSAPGGMAIVGEKGPEIMHVPRGAQIIPNHKIGSVFAGRAGGSSMPNHLKGYADGTPGWRSLFSSSSSSSHSSDSYTFHLHGMHNGEQVVDHVMRNLPRKLKTRSPGFSPLSR